MGFDTSDISEKKIKEAVQTLFNFGTLSEVKGISEEEMEAVYSLGFNFYNTGRFDDAETVFKFLVMYNHLCQKYWIGMGAVMQVKKEYDKAVTAYSFAAFLDLDNPKPMYFSAECFMAKGDKENAISALDALDEFSAKNTEEGREFRKKAAELRTRIEG